MGHDLSRRRMVQLLAAFGITGPAAAQVAAQVGDRVTAATLKDALPLIQADLTDAQLDVISKVIQKNMDQYRILRDLEIDDRIEPAPIFLARGRV